MSLAPDKKPEPELPEAPSEPEAPPPSTSFWSWSSAPTTNAESKLTDAAKTLSPPSSGGPADQTPESVQKDPAQSDAASPEPNTGGSCWWPWLMFSSVEPVDSESDVEDKVDAESFKEAKLAIESGKESCHYAIAGLRTSELDSPHLAVHGTRSETAPVRYNRKKRPLMPCELLESAMLLSRPPKPEPPAPEPDTKKQNGTAKPASVKSPILSTAGTEQPGNSKPADQPDPSNIPGSSAGSVKSIEVPHITGGTVLPHLDSNFRTITIPTNLRLWCGAIVSGQNTSETHLYKSTEGSISKKRRRVVKRAVVISVHSFLPTKLVKSFIGQNTGNALLFAHRAMEAVQRWTSAESTTPETFYIALDGVGVINKRAEASFALLKNWTTEIKNAEFVYVVANSLASPAAIILLQQMCASPEFGMRGKKVGLLSMAGAISGPYPGLDARVVRRAYNYGEFDIIKELFELQKSTSELSQQLQAAINGLCQNNVKLTFAGAYSDQFIPLYSSIGHQLRHPNVFKCMYLESNAGVANFMTKLFSLMLTMENVGYSVQNLMFELLEYIQGSASASGSHAVLHSDLEMYDVGVKFAMETTSLKYSRDARKSRFHAQASDSERSLYNIPWNARGLVNDLVTIKHINSLRLLGELVLAYREWTPTTRQQRELKASFAALEDMTNDDLIQ